MRAKKFFKYHSLGNDFILFDWYKETQNFINKELNSEGLKTFVIKICERNFGIGADGVFILKKDPKDNLPEGIIFNSDGSKAEICLNGLRCMANHLYNLHDFPSSFFVSMGKQKIDCSVERLDNKTIITTKIKSAEILGKKEIGVDNKKISGQLLDISNPHFVIFEKTNMQWIKKNGKKIQSHKEFIAKTNVEFVWKKENNVFNVLVYERGAGPTLACSSGAACVLKALLSENKIKKEEKINISMPGGNLLCWIDDQNDTYLKTSSKLVFCGTIS